MKIDADKCQAAKIETHSETSSLYNQGRMIEAFFYFIFFQVFLFSLT